MKTVVAVYTGQGLAEPMRDIYRELLPDCRIVTIVDDSLIHDVVKAGQVTPAVTRRLIQYYQNGAEMGADAIFNTCSSVGEVAELARGIVDAPIVRIDDAMTYEAASKYERIGVLATLPTTLEPTKRLLRRQAEKLGKPVAIVDGLAEGAYDALVGGSPERHDQILLETAERVAGQADALVLAQGSMARMEERLAALGIPVLSSPYRGVLAVKKLLEEAGRGR
ncbi:aspartate/glutamate racemase family protein [Cohnella zeiphila]|uniref:Asp/Glu/hydantoin racemase n=1 Tax=Cohnella zeiphila TaxID=2761120 RepID=A0A7X0SJB4_9BACL|nr:aspartate/glutamate racemase family protein [Cohnella zeiphila]MBB6731029.1 Asp/Glu/hydantoin racemase [Cohnella zeiphila]